ncbi:MAG: hypothetical protein Q9215_007127 [Flavoplaca cf. flavocitrina]
MARSQSTTSPGISKRKIGQLDDSEGNPPAKKRMAEDAIRESEVDVSVTLPLIIGAGPAG